MLSGHPGLQILQTHTQLGQASLSVCLQWKQWHRVKREIETSGAFLTFGRGLLMWQLIPPTCTILGMRGRGTSSIESDLFKQNITKKFLLAWNNSKSAFSFQALFIGIRVQRKCVSPRTQHWLLCNRPNITCNLCTCYLSSQIADSDRTSAMPTSSPKNS